MVPGGAERDAGDERANRHELCVYGAAKVETDPTLHTGVGGRLLMNKKTAITGVQQKQADAGNDPCRSSSRQKEGGIPRALLPPPVPASPSRPDLRRQGSLALNRIRGERDMTSAVVRRLRGRGLGWGSRAELYALRGGPLQQARTRLGV